MTDFQPSRQQADLADVLELLLDKGIVINADIAVSIGDTELLGVQLRAAIASFETAAKYGLAFPEGTDMDRLAAAVDEPELAESDRPNIPIDATRGVNVTGEDGRIQRDSSTADREHTLDEFEDDDHASPGGEDDGSPKDEGETPRQSATDSQTEDDA
ncbi:gas vesicle protein GvpA [Halovivax asiaticus JCM 14624]|uniref:Gas vesicle protein GvpA n=1 Tax=Halovivax asiaticus JCM 14624 TaxID=1227490 RepID=M0BCU7_9EURY|nr:gas vesicle protein [Halovivax asiaticus]ELZ08640.1 gas vesicle protein GvpA [Halovivax asiaticus JCM 14624]